MHRFAPGAGPPRASAGDGSSCRPAHPTHVAGRPRRARPRGVLGRSAGCQRTAADPVARLSRSGDSIMERNEFLLADGTRPAIRTFTPRRVDSERASWNSRSCFTTTGWCPTGFVVLRSATRRPSPAPGAVRGSITPRRRTSWPEMSPPSPPSVSSWNPFRAEAGHRLHRGGTSRCPPHPPAPSTRYRRMV